MPAHNAEKTIRRCVEAVRDSVPAGTELIIIDDGSLDATREISRALCDRLVVLPCQSGASRARNEGIRVATGDIVLFVDSDVVINKAAVDGLLAALGSGLDAVFGAYEPLPPPEARSMATNYKNLVHHLTHVTGGPRLATTFWSGFSALYRDVFNAVGGFDPAVTRSADVEDIHLGYRLGTAGFRIGIEPASQVQHLKRYTTRGLFASDFFHRAIPWTRAMLELRTFRSDMNLAGPSVVGVGMFLVGTLAAVAAPFTNVTLGLVGAVGLIGGWLWTQRGIVLASRRVGGWKLGIAAVGYGAAFCIYAPAGAVLGALAYAVRPRNNSVRNTAALVSTTEDANPTTLTIVVVASPLDTAEQVDRLLAAFPVDERYEVLVVTGDSSNTSSTGPDGLARRVGIEPNAEPRECFQRALDEANGGSIVFLEPGLEPGPDWIDRALSAAERGFLVTGGSFTTTTTSTQTRAAMNGWFWPWRPERSRGWMEDHPTMNAVFNTAAARQVGGFLDRATIYRRLSVFGARVVHFDPTLRVNVTSEYRFLSMKQRFSLSRVQADSMITYYDNGAALRAARVLHTVATFPIAYAGYLRRARLEGTFDRVFASSLPRTALWTCADKLGFIIGLCSPRKKDPRSSMSLPKSSHTELPTV